MRHMNIYLKVLIDIFINFDGNFFSLGRMRIAKYICEFARSDVDTDASLHNLFHEIAHLYEFG